MPGIVLPPGTVEPIGAVGEQPGGVVALRQLDPSYVGAPLGTHRWTLLSVQGPAIVYPLYGPDYLFTPWATAAAGVAAPNITSFHSTLLYTYKQPGSDNQSAFVTPTFQHSVNGGICYLDQAGDWLVGLDAVVPLTIAVIPIFRPSQADEYLRGRRPNTRHCIRTDLPAAGTGTAQAGLLLGWDIRRRGYWISNNAGKVAAVRFGDSGTAPFVSLADLATLRVGPDESPMSPVMIEAGTGAAVVNGLTVTTDLL